MAEHLDRRTSVKKRREEGVLRGEELQFGLNAAMSHTHPGQCWADVFGGACKPAGTKQIRDKRAFQMNLEMIRLKTQIWHGGWSTASPVRRGRRREGQTGLLMHLYLTGLPSGTRGTTITSSTDYKRKPENVSDLNHVRKFYIYRWTFD